MNHQKIVAYLWVLGILLGLVELNSCSPSCSAPDKTEYRYGLFDSIGTGTQVLFESNTGLLDTLCYDTLSKKMRRTSNGRARCEETFTNLYYNEQDISFKNSSSLSMLSFFITTNEHNNFPYKKGNINFYTSLDGKIYVTRGWLYHFNETFDTFLDTEKVVIINNVNDTTGYCICSKRYGIVKIHLKNGSSADTTFNFKKIIK